MDKASWNGPRHARPKQRLGRALLLTAASAIVPGTAHLARGRYRAGMVLLCVFLVLAAAGAVAAAQPREDLLRLMVQPRWLLAAALAAVVLALAWVAVVVWSYRTVRPSGLSTPKRVVAGIAITSLCALVCAPLVLAASLAQAQRGLITSVFPNVAPFWNLGAEPAYTNTWDTGRLNVLLLGGDAHTDELGIRTDVMILASIDPTTGRTVLLSLPRNLQRAPMPFPEMRERFPHGFPEFLFGLWRYGESHPELVPGARAPGARLLSATVEKITGLPVDYYVLVDLKSFKALINALGGVWLNVQEPIPYGEHGQFVVADGYRKLGGREALWFARSRHLTSDYDRMRRQRCLLGALADQADPLTVLRNFRELTSAAERTVTTNIPRGVLPDMIGVGYRIKDATITNLQFVPPVVDTGEPDYDKIRRLARSAIGRSSAPAAQSPASPDSARTALPAETHSAPAGREGPRERATPGATPGSADAAEPVALEAACPSPPSSP